ncbi:MAG: hypothetical protein EOP06_30570, partial [Proteobacteria bacterium]
MKNLKRSLLALLFALPLTGEAQTCSSVFAALRAPSVPAGVYSSGLRSENHFEVRGEISLNGVAVGKNFKEALTNADVKQAIENSKTTTNKIILEAQMSAKDGGGRLRLVTLDTSRYNLAYNHVELVALLKVNPRLANALGIHEVEGYENMAWIPDVTQMNYNLQRLAREKGFDRAIFSYEAANGIVGPKPYLELLTNGKFPFSNNNELNLVTHDAMHSVSFAVMNGTLNGRKVLRAAQRRSEVSVNIMNRLVAEMGSDGPRLSDYVLNKSAAISTDSLERTMLLTVLVTGNYDYFSS